MTKRKRMRGFGAAAVLSSVVFSWAAPAEAAANSAVVEALPGGRESAETVEATARVARRASRTASRVGGVLRSFGRRGGESSSEGGGEAENPVETQKSSARPGAAAPGAADPDAAAPAAGSTESSPNRATNAQAECASWNREHFMNAVLTARCLEAGLDPNARLSYHVVDEGYPKGGDGWATPLHFAMTATMVDVLVEAGADVNARSSNNCRITLTDSFDVDDIVDDVTECRMTPFYTAVITIVFWATLPSPEASLEGLPAETVEFLETSGFMEDPYGPVRALIRAGADINARARHLDQERRDDGTYYIVDSEFTALASLLPLGIIPDIPGWAEMKERLTGLVDFLIAAGAK